MEALYSDRGGGVKDFDSMLPIWVTRMLYSAVYAQMSTMFVEQGMLMDTNIGSFSIPPASLSTFDVISVLFWVPIYDRIVVRIARKFTGRERGFSELQRMGIGLFVSVLAMAAAALVETRRLQLAIENTGVALSIFWLIPQYMLVGAAGVLTFVGKLEFFYEQSPDGMRSLCSALPLLTVSMGNYLSTVILTMVKYFTTRGGNPGWIPDDLNEGHLYYYFWLLAGIGVVDLFAFIACARRYKSKKAA